MVDLAFAHKFKFFTGMNNVAGVVFLTLTHMYKHIVAVYYSSRFLKSCPSPHLHYMPIRFHQVQTIPTNTKSSRQIGSATITKKSNSMYTNVNYHMRHMVTVFQFSRINVSQWGPESNSLSRHLFADQLHRIHRMHMINTFRIKRKPTVL